MGVWSNSWAPFSFNLGRPSDYKKFERNMNMNMKKQNCFAAASLAVLLWCAFSAQAQYAGSNQTNTFSNVSNTWVGAYSVGSNFFNDALIISTGGKLTNGYAYLGFNAGDNNNGAQVTGTNSLWFTTNELVVGVSGSFNTMTVAASGKVLNANGYIGSNTTAIANSVLVTDPGTVWGNKTNLYVGYLGSSNTLTIANGGMVTNTGGYIGNSVGANNNAITVTGAGSMWTNRTDAYVGFAGAGNQLTIANGGKVVDGNGILSSNAASSGNSVLVTDPGSIWTNRANLYVGYLGAGNTLTVTNGGKVYDGIAYIGYTSNAVNNSVIVTGAGSIWSNRTGNLSIGEAGGGNTLIIANGGFVNGYNGNGNIGTAATATNNSVLVTGAGSVWTNNFLSLNVGNLGSFNTLTISNGGAVYINNSSYAYIGSSALSSNNAVTVTGAGSLWSISQGLTVGQGSFNVLTIANGGMVVDNNQGSIVGSNNSALVTGAGSVWSNRNSDVVIGSSGIGNSLTIANGGLVTAVNGHIGFTGGSSNTVLVTGNGSVWSNSGVVYVGEQGAGMTLTVTNGGAVFNNGFGYVGGPYLTSSNNTAVVTGPGSVWNNGTNLNVGAAGPNNTLVVNKGGAVIVGGALTVSAFAGASNNAVNINGGQVIVTNGPINVGPAGSAQFNLAGGSVLGQQLVATNGPNSAVNFSQGTLDLAVATVINGSTFMVGDSTHAATLNLRGGQSGFANDVQVSSNAFLTGFGTIANGNALIQPGGTLAPGNGSTLGVFTFSNQLRVAGTVAIKLQSTLGPLGTGDFLNVVGALDVTGGTLDFIPLDTPTNDVYVFCAYGSLLGTMIATNDVPAGYVFQTAYNGNELALVAVPEPASLGILMLIGGGLIWRRLRRSGHAMRRT